MAARDPGPERIRLFQNERLEAFTLIAPRTFAVAWALLLPLIAWVAFGTADLMVALVLVLTGFIAWTLFEYAMHRYLFHWSIGHPGVKRFVFLIHGNHHDRSNDRLRDLMPLSASLPILGTVWGVFLLLLGAAGTWSFLGFAIGYVTYDTVHYACHQWAMRGRLGRMLKRHHMRHHYVDEAGNFAIAAIFWDSVFGTRIRSLKSSKPSLRH